MITCSHGNRAYFAKGMCRNCYYKQWQSDNPEKYKRSYRNATLKKKYGITLEEYEAMLEAQGYRCLICNDKLMPGFKTHVDHNHVTGRVRGLLCHPCNVAIGFMREDVRIVKRILGYLEADRGIE
jgi:hypothetical protein